MVKIKKKRKGDRYIIIERPNSGMHISIHRSGHTHLKDKSGLHVDKEDITKVLLSIPGIEKKLIEKGSLTATPCEKYPACICIDLFLNPFLLEDGFGELCISLQKYSKGGLCPNYEGRLCIWAEFCRKGIDPTPYASSF